MGRLAINFLRTHIDMSQRHPDALRMSDEVVEALDLMYDLANDPSLHLTMEFQPGDVQLLHNHQILHDRTAYEDWDDEDRKRYLLRLWLSPPDGIELPQAFAGRYNSVTAGDRGGVTIPGMEKIVPLTPV
ncbi:MAG: TauD/TfdA family dioxygenase, partial [Pseudomonadota bacterium]|nr:TauD/TfdA family dioxygenase [Pseudomonadota bacterium]